MNPEYNETVFKTLFPKSEWPKSFAIITACNPCGITVHENENALLNEQLEFMLKKEGLSPWRVIGQSPDGNHGESGYMVETNLPSALAIGKQFQQDAIFWIEDGQLFLTDCSNGTLHALGEWISRLT